MSEAPKSRQQGQTSRELQGVRERLMSSTGTAPAFDYELLFIFANNHLRNAVAIPGLATGIAIISMMWTPWIAAVAWLCFMLAAHSATLGLSRKFLSMEADAADIPKWRRRFTLSEMASGIAWGGLILVPVQGGTAAGSIFVFSSLLMVMAVRAILSGPILPSVYSGTVPITLAIVFKSFMEPDSHFMAMAAIALCAQGYFVLLSRHMLKTSVAMLTFRAEKDKLIAQLEEEMSKLNEARRRAEDANVAKSRFLATMSHELRTPLNAILGFSEVMKNQLFGPHSSPQYADYATDIHRSGKHLLDLISEILDLSRIEAGRYQLKEEATTLRNTVEDCCYLMSLRANDKDIELIQDFEENLPYLWADERAIRQIALNLLSNAVKFTPTGGKVTVRVGWTSSGGQYLSVTDTGPGVPEDEVPKILTAFGQGTLAHKAAEDGAGLGLPIVQGLVNLHNGKFNFVSELRVGTEVLVTFPAKRVMEVLPALVEPRNKTAA
ncbi:MAG: HAMP domain-containing sensor histidine kinase [Pseudomonadota bacterium]